jgi:cobyrinic acid a,c-diamide synthase
LAKLLECPVVVAVDCTKSTRTVGALVLGCQRLDPDVPIRGVILNRTAGPRHESVLLEAIQQICDLPVLGTIPRIREQIFPERHLGLVPPQEHDRLIGAIDRVADVARQYLDLDAILRVARTEVGPACRAGPGTPENLQTEAKVPLGKRDLPDRSCGTERSVPPRIAPSPFPGSAGRPTIGVFRDAAFQFYYPENLEGLVREGASLLEISPLRDAELPPVDALYIGGGFPETLAPALADNVPFLQSLRRSVEEGLPIYAECGGAVFLGERLVYEQNEYPMVGALPVSFAFQKRPQGHGYVELQTVEDNPFYPIGELLRGHEFHYTYMQAATADDLNFAFQVRRGHGFDGQRDGLCRGNILACYTHVHALGTESWAPSLVRAAVRFRSCG